MAYVGQFVDSTAPSATELNNPFAGCVLFKTTAQALAGNTLVTLTWTAAGDEVRDSLNWHSTTTNPTRITVSIAGIYRFNGTVKANGTLGNGAYGQFLKNGTVVAREAADLAGSGAESSFSLSWTGVLAANDYLEFAVRNNQATARNTTFSGFAGYLLGT